MKHRPVIPSSGSAHTALMVAVFVCLGSSSAVNAADLTSRLGVINRVPTTRRVGASGEYWKAHGPMNSSGVLMYFQRLEDQRNDNIHATEWGSEVWTTFAGKWSEVSIVLPSSSLESDAGDETTHGIDLDLSLRVASPNGLTRGVGAVFGFRNIDSVDDRHNEVSMGLYVDYGQRIFKDRWRIAARPILSVADPSGPTAGASTTFFLPLRLETQFGKIKRRAIQSKAADTLAEKCAPFGMEFKKPDDDWYVNHILSGYVAYEHEFETGDDALYAGAELQFPFTAQTHPIDPHCGRPSVPDSSARRSRRSPLSVIVGLVLRSLQLWRLRRRWTIWLAVPQLQKAIVSHRSEPRTRSADVELANRPRRSGGARAD